MPDWTPSEVGAEFELPYILEPLTSRQAADRSCSAGWPKITAGRTATVPATTPAPCPVFSPASRPRKTHGADINVGVSVDQVAARKVGQRTKFPSLEIGCDRGAQAGNCDSGYSCSYSTNIVWRTDTTPQAKEIDPKLVFERLFSIGSAADQRTKREKYRKSVLDFVLEDANDLRGRLGGKDQRKLDEYLTGVRELEKRIAMAGRETAAPLPDYPIPAGIPGDYRRAHPLDVRPAGAGLPGRPDARGHVRRGQRGEQPGLSVHRRARRPSRPVAPRRQRGKAEEDPRDQSLPRHPARPTSWKSCKASARASARCWTMLDDPLRQRHRRRQRPQPRQPADPAGRARRRHDRQRPPRASSRKRRRSTISISRCSTAWSRRSNRWATAPAGSKCSAKLQPASLRPAPAL